jgi:aspartyl-tRNA(Asn)/glutamyl-tRNA(Gln) amidotransferase subunit A
MTDEHIAFSDALALGELIAKRRISSVELTRLYLQRLHTYGHVYGAVVTIMDERALREAAAADKELARGRSRGALHGVPYGVKDLLAAAGAPTTWGAAPYRNQVFDDDATVVKRLRAAGCVLLAKLAMVELAGGFGYNEADASFTGPARTPWNPDYWSGGSSSGPGACVAAGLVGFAIGSETNGSIMNPSSFCGVSGLRPTFGRVSRYGAMALMWSSDKLGPMCRSARDTQAVLRIIAGADPLDDTAVDAPFPTVRGRRPKIGVLKDGTAKSMPAVVENFEASLGVLRSFCDVVPEVALPEGPYGDVFTALLNGECAAAFRDLIESGRSRELQSKEDRVGGYQQYGTLAVDYVDAMRRRKKLNEAVMRAFAPYDATAYPNQPTVALPVSVPFDQAYPQYPGGPDMGSPGNLAGLPAIGVPNGFGDHHLPTGLALMGRAWGEFTLTRIAQAYQARTTFHMQHPTVPDSICIHVKTPMTSPEQLWRRIRAPGAHRQRSI